ncbi:phosphohydrolase [Bacillus sp. V3-13]|uniref:HD domain-containing protein n=1 Tax=Bacillus sp. V3-13 TaxID=2053728 RepID=UPI000C78E9ED|nr:HD domain-containing protein [Bacillus sp. V3-13]PLR77227.1 phosphohydrolase [Bacillus sp. V3-13]
MKKIIRQSEEFVKESLRDDATGHDWHHIDRVRKNALNIASKEQRGDLFVIEMAALLHDTADEKLNVSGAAGEKKLLAFMDTLDLSIAIKEHILDIIFSISYKGGNSKALASIEAEIVQDADRLDAIGAIGIARTFAYGGSKGQPIYDPRIETREKMTVEEYRNGKSSSIHHFYEKLLKLKDLLHTDAAKQLAEARHQFMEQFLQEFHSEWNGEA